MSLQNPKVRLEEFLAEKTKLQKAIENGDGETAMILLEEIKYNFMEVVTNNMYDQIHCLIMDNCEI